MAVDEQWIEIRRDDSERVGWLRMDGDDFVAVDLLGRERTGRTDWEDAESVLLAAGIGYLAEPYELQLDDGSWERVRLTQVSSDRIVAKQEDFGAIDGPNVQYVLPFPAPPNLRPLT